MTLVKKILILVLLAGLIAGGFGIYHYYKPVGSLENTVPDFSTDAVSLYNDFLMDEDAANKKYLGKVIEITGEVRNSAVADSGKYIVSIEAGDDMAGVSCEVNAEKNPSAKLLKAGDGIKAKGVCSGKLMDVVLINCFIEKNK